VVLTTGEVAELMKAVRGDAWLVCKLLYGCGLRVAEALACAPLVALAGFLV
jgi:hypothetical protein